MPEEQLRGRLNLLRRASEGGQSERLVQAYENLAVNLERFSEVNILRFTSVSLECHRELLRQKMRVGTKDLRIASIALAIDGIVVTRNQRDFSQVPNLNTPDSFCSQRWTEKLSIR